jgi:hypothetical protein
MPDDRMVKKVYEWTPCQKDNWKNKKDTDITVKISKLLQITGIINRT